MKLCTKCKVIKPNTEFVRNKSRPDDLAIYCKGCSNQQGKDFSTKNPEKRDTIYRRSWLKLQYGITLEQYQELFDKQKGCCAICSRHQTELSKRLSVEHNHQTREIRALACDYCNRYVIGKHTDPELFRRAAFYLENAHTGWFVPVKKKKRRRYRSRR